MGRLRPGRGVAALVSRAARTRVDFQISAVQDAAMELPTLGAFRLLRLLREQPTWTKLYLAEEVDHPTPAGRTPAVLIKLMGPGEGEVHDKLVAHFEHERRLLEAFNHASIPSYRGGGEQDGVRWMAMEYIDGVDLGVLLGHAAGEPRALSKEIAVYLIGQIADALDHVHNFEELMPDGSYASLHILHRDISPPNILLSRFGDVILSDFGAASSTWLPAHVNSRDAGTKAYMAPERIIGGGEASVKTDLFALATVLWEILKGQRCFWQNDELKTLEAIARFDVSQPTRRVSGLSPRLSEVLRKNLDRDPARRFDDAYQVLQRLAQAGEAAQAEQARISLASLVNESMRELGAS